MEGRQLLDARGITGAWLGQDGNDYAKCATTLGRDGIQDVHVALQGLPAGRTISFIDIQGMGYDRWQYGGTDGYSIKVVPSGATTADLYFAPVHVETGRMFAVNVRFDDGSTADLWVGGGTADPTLQMPALTLTGSWLGQDGHDYAKCATVLGPDGIQDVHVALQGLPAGRSISFIDVQGLGYDRWQYGGTDGYSIKVVPSGGTTADLYFAPVHTETGRPFAFNVILDNGSTANFWVGGGTADPNLHMPVTTVSGTWLGQDGHDTTKCATVLGSDGVQDVHVTLQGLPADRSISFIDIQGLGYDRWQYGGTQGFAVDVQRTGATTADLYFAPVHVETGRPFAFQVRFDDGSTSDFWVGGGTADPNLRMPGLQMAANWLGQDGHDSTGPGAGVGPDGFQDVHLTLANLSPDLDIASALLTGPAGSVWRYGLNRQGDTSAELIRNTTDRSRADFYYSPGIDLFGQTLTLSIVYADGHLDSTTFVAGHAYSTLAMPAPAPVPVVWNVVTAGWLGQDGKEPAAPGNAHLTLAGIPTGRTVVAATLSDPAGGSWVYRSASASTYYADPTASVLSYQAASASGPAVLGFAPNRNEAGATMTLRLLLDDGTTLATQFLAGQTDPGLRSPSPDTSAVTAHPGDNLNDLANRFGTVHLTAGTYNLDQPLVLNRPVSILADPGVVLLFQQAAGAAPWSTAIKIHSGNTTLSGFAVRFAGPIRWADGVSYGAAVIGTTDNLDGPGHNDPRVNIVLTGLDLETPPPASSWEMAPSLMRLVSAGNGRIEGNTLRGGLVEFQGGPWRIVNNTYNGTVPGTYSYAVFAGHQTHDLILSGNTAQPVGASGKTWRFLVLTNSGIGDLIQNNTVVGIGAQDTDTVPNPNAPEIILTESYRLHFEGQPAAVSADGRVLQVPMLQGDAPRSGDVVAILSGPNAGRWYRIAQVLGPTTFLMADPLPQDVGVISIATGFVNETFQGNTIDARGSSVALDLDLQGNHFGTQVLNNHLLGGNVGLLFAASPTESPVQWGWSHAPVLGAVVAGNLIEDSRNAAVLNVIHGTGIKSNRDRLYFSATVTNNVVRWTDSFLSQYTPTGTASGPPAWTIGNTQSLDPEEMVLTFNGNLVQGPAGYLPTGTLIVTSGTINGQEWVDQSFALPTVPPAAPTGLELDSDTGASHSDRITSDGRVRFDAVAGAVGYEYRLGASGSYQTLGITTAFLPVGLSDGTFTVWVRAYDATGNRGAEASLTFTLDTTAPTPVAPVLAPGSDTGSSQTDNLTSATSPTFQVGGNPTDTLILLRNGVEVRRRTGPGLLTDPNSLSDGSYSYSVKALDLAGNSASSPVTTITVDATAPVAPSVTVSTSGQVQVLGGESGLYYQYRIENTQAYYQPGGFGPSFWLQGLAEGVNTVLFRAIDPAGNVGPDTRVVVTVPTTPKAAWLGQDGHDLVGPYPQPGGDGIQDIHILLTGLPTTKTLKAVEVRDYANGRWRSDGVGAWRAGLVVNPATGRADLYLQPVTTNNGRTYWIRLYFSDGSVADLYLKGGRVDSQLRMP